MAISTINQNGLANPLSTPGSLTSTTFIQSQGTGSVNYGGVWLDFTAPNGRIGAINSSGSPAANLLFSTTATNGTITEGMRIDYQQYVGISGAPTGLAMLDVRSNSTTIPQLFLQQDNTAHGWIFYADRADGHLKFSRRDNSGSTERVRFTSDGNVLIGTTTAGANLTVASGKNSGFLQQLYTTTNGADYIQFYNGSQVGSITRSGGTNVNYNTSSDYRLKYDVKPMQGALARISQLKPVTYKWKVDDSEGEGFIAHELQSVCPQAVHGEKDAVNEDGSINPQGIDTSHIVGLLTAAIQELKAEFDEYKRTHP